ncbi:MAG TPA: hypothetical protein VL987_17040 [Cellvibrio sp.]|nr:hypothetical protein [Cellvibrio sp.]
MRFKVKADGGFKGAGRDFEFGNTHDSVRLSIRDDDVLRWYRAGFVDIEGYPVGPAAMPGKTEIAVENVSVTKAVSSAQ